MWIKECCGVPSYIGLPKGMIVLFFGKTKKSGGEYCIIYASEKSLKDQSGRVIYLDGEEAKIAIGKYAETMAVFSIVDGLVTLGMSRVEFKMQGRDYITRFGMQLDSPCAMHAGEWMEEIYVIPHMQ